MARVSVVEFWRDIYGSPPNVMMDRYLYTAATGVVSMETFNIGGGGLGAFHPPAGTRITYECDGNDLVEYFSLGDNTGVNDVQTDNHPSCCTVNASDFSIVKTNNTHPSVPNGTLKITSTVLDINDYEISIDEGGNYVQAVDDEINFTGLAAGNYNIIIKTITGVCSVTTGISIIDNIVYPPPIVEESTQPSLYSPVFHPISLGYSLQNNQIVIKEDVNGTYLEVDSDDEKDYLATLPIIKIFDNEDYEGVVKVQSVDDVDDPQKFYVNLEFTTEQNALFVPFDRQVFELYAETAFNNYVKIADITVYPDADTGEYRMRLEGFLQGVFKIQPPVNNGDEITLLRNYYLLPRDFDLAAAYTIYKAVFSAIPDLTEFLEDFKPLGPAPINFINEQTQKGFPVLFSYIDTDTGRVVNVTSSNQTEVVSASDVVFINGLPLNQYDLTWVNPLGAISDLQVSPALPAWIVLETSPSDTVQLSIDTGLTVDGGDYDGSDYDGDDYLTGGPNAIVGCFEFVFSDGATELFTLRICIFPIQSSNEIKCAVDPINIAWINREGGWSSYVFEGSRTYGKEIGDVKTYKVGTELKKSSVENVYDTVEIQLSNKSIRDLIFISSLRQSIQAFLWSEETLQWSIPIVIDKQTFPVYKKPFRQVEVEDKFMFRYANEVVIQSQ